MEKGEEVRVGGGERKTEREREERVAILQGL